MPLHKTADAENAIKKRPMAVITKSNENQPAHTIKQQQKSLMSHYFNTINQ